MKLNDIIKSNNWLSVQLTLLSLYPDQETLIDEYENVFEKLRSSNSIDKDLKIVLTKYDSEDENDSYIDVSGRKIIPDPDSITNSYALEFTKWNEWLGMDICQTTLNDFNELEIITHCLYEMTFFSFDEDEIQKQIASLEKTIEEYKEFSGEEKKSQTFTLDELLKKTDEDPNEN
jgi:hypothetical protein